MFRIYENVFYHLVENDQETISKNIFDNKLLNMSIIIIQKNNITKFYTHDSIYMSIG